MSPGALTSVVVAVVLVVASDDAVCVVEKLAPPRTILAVANIFVACSADGAIRYRIRSTRVSRISHHPNLYSHSAIFMTPATEPTLPSIRAILKIRKMMNPTATAWTVPPPKIKARRQVQEDSGNGSCTSRLTVVGLEVASGI